MSTRRSGSAWSSLLSWSSAAMPAATSGAPYACLWAAVGEMIGSQSTYAVGLCRVEQRVAIAWTLAIVTPQATGGNNPQRASAWRRRKRAIVERSGC
jgi:hypothetical protein